MRPQFTEAWNAALDRLITAAEDTAQFRNDVPIGRSRTASIRRLAAAIDALRALELEHDRAELERKSTAETALIRPGSGLIKPHLPR